MTIFYSPKYTPLDSSGSLMPGAKLYFYQAGTTTPLDTYTNQALSVAHDNPVIADSEGVFDTIFLQNQSYKAVLKTSADVEVWTQDNIKNAISDVVEDETPQLGGPLDTNGHIVKLSKGDDVVTATTVTPGSDGNYFDLTGTTAVTAFGAVSVGNITIYRTTGIFTLTHHATNLILPGGADITTAAGDHFAIVEYDTGKHRCLWYTKAADNPNYPEPGTFTPTLFGSSVEGTPTITSAAGTYVRIGPDSIWIAGRISWTSLGSAAGDIRIGGLPIAAFGATSSTMGNFMLSVARCSGLNLASGNVLAAYVSSSSTYISLVTSNNTASNVEVTESELSSSGQIYFTGTYGI